LTRSSYSSRPRTISSSPFGVIGARAIFYAARCGNAIRCPYKDLPSPKAGRR
jgi:hypothetical protein